MKRLILAIAMALTLSSCGLSYYTNNIPTPVSGSINISLQPSWGPAGYNYAMYYYFPEFNFYYDVERALFYYTNYGRWVSAKMLPRGRHFPTDLHRFYKVVINYRNPWLYNKRHRSMYKKYKGIYTQPIIGNGHHNGHYNPHNPHSPYRQPSNRYDHNDSYYGGQKNGQYGTPDKNNYGKDGNGQYNGSRNNGYYNNSGADNRNTVRNSRNTNTSRNNSYQGNTPQRGSSQNTKGNNAQYGQQNNKQSGQATGSRTNAQSRGNSS
ncbi:MAG: hypothetical protein IJD72_01460, partial [Alistipes sp.]|nr:hypothetical protein [Alistipes sp.]